MFTGKRFSMMTAIPSGVAAGLVGYFIGEYVYMLFVFPFALLLIGTMFYLLFMRFSKTTDTLHRALGGLVMGLTALLVFHYIEYSIFRSNVIARIETAQNTGRADAISSFNSFLKDQTGQEGFLGFLNYQQARLRPFSYSFTRDGKIIRTFAFYLHGKTAWLYLAGEASVLLGGGILAGIATKRFA